jgi:hypothetical protein
MKVGKMWWQWVSVVFWLSLKAKAVPLHATEALGGKGGVAPTHFRPRH